MCKEDEKKNIENIDMIPHIDEHHSELSHCFCVIFAFFLLKSIVSEIDRGGKIFKTDVMFVMINAHQQTLITISIWNICVGSKWANGDLK